MKICSVLIVFFFCCSLFSENIQTFYGVIEVEEPVLLELIQSAPMQRLKEIHQYGVAYYTTHREEYNRYDHSIGVFALLRKNGATLEEQIAGLLHDISHTVFSHVGDWVFGKEYQEEDYQSLIYKIYLSHSGIENILLNHGFTINQIFPKREKFVMLEQPLPNLCADRIDYNIQGAFFRDFLTKQEALELYDDFKFVEGQWVATRTDLLKKMTEFALFMTQDCWGSASNYVASRLLADAMIEGLEIGLISWHEIHFGIDQSVWSKLIKSDHSGIQKKMQALSNLDDHYRFVCQKDADKIIKFRCRSIDPWVLYKGEKIRLSSLDSELAESLETLKAKAAVGWSVQFTNNLLH